MVSALEKEWAGRNVRATTWNENPRFAAQCHVIFGFYCYLREKNTVEESIVATMRNEAPRFVAQRHFIYGLIVACARRVQWKKELELLCGMETQDLQPNGITYNALINAIFFNLYIKGNF